jgi:predicted deacetylase
MVKKRSNKTKYYFLIIILLAMAIHLFTSQRNVEYTNQVTAKSEVVWGSVFSPYRQKVRLMNLVPAKDAYIKFDHLAKSIYGKSDPRGRDIQLIEHLPNNSFNLLNIEIYNLNESDTIIKALSDLKIENTYYIYYGGNLFNDNQITFPRLSKLPISFLQLDTEEEPEILLRADRKWNIINVDKNIKININTQLDLNDIELYIYQNNILKKLSYSRISKEELQIQLNELSVGKYEIYLIANTLGTYIRSNSFELIISEPIYVAWTIDWEGIDPEQKYLDQMALMSNRYKVPMTHFWNPRILINLRISKERRNALVNWLKSRLNAGDDLGMHLHMNYDVLEESGVKPKYNARTWDNGISGYDTPSTEYSYEEYLKILKWGIAKMESVGFKDIKGFRAGGWFADIENLRAISDAGFMYDSSARVSFDIGRNKLRQPWEISYTTQPYYPNTEDQNSSDSPNMKLLQIPNNGGDSYWSKADELYSNFLMNYTPLEIALEAKLVTYLSHPEWFNIDEPKLHDLFRKLQMMSRDLDNGPVVFVTLREWLKYNIK